jgi:hypothetical protein
MFLTFLSGCAQISMIADTFSDDPVTRAGLREKELHSDKAQNDYDFDSSSDDRELRIGMRREDVIQVWGRPLEVETAGEPGKGNQRWIYTEDLSHRWLIKPKKVVYFERGRVSGWENASTR